jgi:uncharacterized protein (DUF2164 family)
MTDFGRLYDSFQIQFMLHGLQADLDFVTDERARYWNAGDEEAVNQLLERGQTLTREITLLRKHFTSKAAKA